MDTNCENHRYLGRYVGMSYTLATQLNIILHLNYWVMHPVVRVSIKYWNNLRTQQSIFSARFCCALLTLHVLAPFGGHLQVVCKHKKYLRQSLYIQWIR
jgi:hypothetical protein